MSIDDLGLIDYEKGNAADELHIDGDSPVYEPCCIFNDDDDRSRRMIAKHINQKVDTLLEDAGTKKYLFFLTTKTNFRDFLVDDYKFSRRDKERPVNLAWAKHWAVKHLNSHWHNMLEADDLLGIFRNENSIIHSIDKDLRQIPGRHLDDATRKIITIEENGLLREIPGKIVMGKRKPTKHYFNGLAGLYFQMLTGDSTDYIVGCGTRQMVVTKSGVNKGQSKLKRVGIGPGEAYKIIAKSGGIEQAKQAVGAEYYKLHGQHNWKKELETQANLLFMVRWQEGEVIKRWTFDDRDEYFDLVSGEILDGYKPKSVTG